MFEAIRVEILDDFKRLCFSYDKPTKTALIKLANSDRKWLSIYKILPQSLASKIYATLLKDGIIKIEKSREKAPIKTKNQKLKKSEKHYKIENKVHFVSHFFRFWFRFIEPNLKLLENGRQDEVLEIIKNGFDEYASLGFELLGAEFLRHKFNIKCEINSFWSRKIELDMLVFWKGKIIVGEAKYKNKKVCKNILNIILNKCKRLGINPDIVAILSKSGFSKELNELKDERLRLYDISDLTEIL